MNDKDRNSIIEQESFKMLLEEFTREQETHNRIIVGLASAVKELSERVSLFEERSNKAKAINVNTDTATIERIISKGIMDMRCGLFRAKDQKRQSKSFRSYYFPNRTRSCFIK
jgi:hypothetical protein